MDQDTTPSETGYDSLVSVSPSLVDILITRRAGLNFSALTDSYNLPYDEQTKACEALNHAFSQTINGGDLYFEPELEQGYVSELLKDGGRVLDIGCGVEGLWVQAAATRFPSAEIIGVDLNPVELDWAPPNASFNVLDVGNGFSCFHNEYLWAPFQTYIKG
ncbi:hypothetical protein BDY24DRAFT_371533 [Mrakia frigida]|uniref:class I SAM-dependent methyltransferase n=1 Tax=Mrakia frigida TaxID=29902 RepID=UPI003FCC0367